MSTPHYLIRRYDHVVGMTFPCRAKKLTIPMEYIIENLEGKKKRLGYLVTIPVFVSDIAKLSF